MNRQIIYFLSCWKEGCFVQNENDRGNCLCRLFACTYGVDEAGTKRYVLTSAASSAPLY
jgi:hypothetical protein